MAENEKRNLYKELETKLNKLSTNSNRTELVEDILFTVYSIVLSKTTISTNQTHELDRLVNSKLLIPLKDCLFELDLNFDPDCSSDILMLRSGIESLRYDGRFQKLNKIPENHQKKASELNQFLQTSENLEGLDETLELWKSYPTTRLTGLWSDYIRKPNIPAKHWWWFEPVSTNSETEHNELNKTETSLVQSRERGSTKSCLATNNETDHTEFKTISTLRPSISVRPEVQHRDPERFTDVIAPLKTEISEPSPPAVTAHQAIASSDKDHSDWSDSSLAPCPVPYNATKAHEHFGLGTNLGRSSSLPSVLTKA